MEGERPQLAPKMDVKYRGQVMEAFLGPVTGCLRVLQGWHARPKGGMQDPRVADGNAGEQETCNQPI